AAAAADYLGWFEGTSQSAGSRLLGYAGRPHPDRLSAVVLARLESSRVPVGLAQASCPGQLLSQRSRRAAHVCAQQTQERAETSVSHLAVLAAGYALVVS